MCQAIVDIREEERLEGEKIGALKKAQENAKNFYQLGVEVEKVAKGVGYDLETVKEWLGLTT